MYRYVFKQIRDTIGLNTINARKSFGCHHIVKTTQKKDINNKNNNNKSAAEQNSSSSRNHETATSSLFGFPGTKFWNQNRNHTGDDFKRKYNCNPRNHSCYINALTLSTALIAVNYFSQLICLYRRNHHRRLNSKNCLYSKYICSQELHKKFFSPPHHHHHHYESDKNSGESSSIDSISRVKASPLLEEYLSKVFGLDTFFEKRFQKYYDPNDENDKSYRAFNVKNDKVPQEKNEINQSVDDDEKIDQIFSSITNIIGQTELQIGIECARRGNFEEAAEHFKMSANSLNHSGCYNLALLYENGFGVDKDMTMAKRLYKTAANWGNRMALYNLGVFYANGLGGKKSYRKARICFEEAARLGDKNASAAMALIKCKPSASFSEPDDYISSDMEPITSFS